MTSSRRLAAVLATGTAAILALSGCAGSTDSAAPGSTTADAVTVATMFGDIEVPQVESPRVIALGWADAEMALALDIQPVAVYAWQSFTAETNGVGPWAGDLFDEAPEVIEGELNYEQILSLDPDLILNLRSDNDEETFERLNDIAPTIYAPEGVAAFATPWEVQMTSIAEALGKPTDGAAIIEETQEVVAAAAASHPEFDGLTIASATKFGDAYGAYLPGDGRVDLLTQLGFVNDPAIAELDSSGFFAAVSAEQVEVFDADVATVLPIGFSKAETEADPLLQSIPAVVDGRAVFLDPESEWVMAYSTVSVLSIPVALEGLVPELATAAAKVS